MSAPVSASMTSLYQDVILDHAKVARLASLREPYDVENHQVNPTCGDEITLRVRLTDGALADVSYEALGCSISQAAASVLAELVVGQPVSHVEPVHRAYLAMLQSKGEDAGDETVIGDGVAFVGVGRYPARVKCALLPWAALRSALLDLDPTTTDDEGRP